MAKSSGLGDNFYVDGFDLSGDINAVDTITGPLALLDSTALRQSAFSRIPGKRDGTMSFTSYFNPAASQEHAVLNTRPTTDRLMSYAKGPPVIGNPSACLNCKQINYDPTRGNDGSLTVKVDGSGNQFGLEWGVMLTPGIRTDTTATAASSANSYDTLASLAFGGQLYLQAFTMIGTSYTPALWDSADNITFAAVTGGAFGAISTANDNAGYRLVISNVSTIRRYVAIATTGTFTSAPFFVMLNKNPIAGVVF